MRCLAHLSDFHFGTEEPQICEALLVDLQEHQPSLAIVTGDFTQRARPAQFRAARQYLDRFPCPWLAIPGNHDVPLYNLWRRFFFPLHCYRRFISEEVNPLWADEEIAALGLNTARSLTWKSGRISHEQIGLIGGRLRWVSPSAVKIIATHHPFIPPPNEPEAGVDLVGRAREALVALDASEVDLLLAGHLHQGYSGDVRTYYPSAKRSVLVIQAGTAVSRRTRTEPNAYNLLQVSKKEISIEVRVWTGMIFESQHRHHYRRDGAVWVRSG